MKNINLPDKGWLLLLSMLLTILMGYGQQGNGSRNGYFKNIGSSTNAHTGEGSVEISSTTNSEVAGSTEGAIKVSFSGLRFYRWNDDDDVYNIFGVWKSNAHLYALNASGPVFTYASVNGIGYDTRNHNILEKIDGNDDSRINNNWMFLGDVGPGRAVSIEFLHNYGKDASSADKDRDWRMRSFTTPRLKNVIDLKDVTVAGKKILQWKKGSNYKSSFLQFEIYRKLAGQSGEGEAVAVIFGTDGQDTYTYTDEETANGVGDYTYTVYTVLSDKAPDDWNKGRDAAEPAKTLNMAYRNPAMIATQDLRGKIKLNWSNLENVKGISQIVLFRDMSVDSIISTTKSIARLNKSAVEYVDETVVPGKTHQYVLRIFNASGTDISRDVQLNSVTTKGLSQRNGRLSGYVKTSNGTPIARAKINLTSARKLNDGIATNYQKDSTYTDNSGYYELVDIYYADSATFNIHASIEGSTKPRFENPDLRRKFDVQEYNLRNVDFKDTASFVVSGHVYYPEVGGTSINLPVKGAEVWINGSNTGITSNQEGFYSVPIAAIGTHALELKSKDHTIRYLNSPQKQIATLYVNKDLPHTDFVDSTKKELLIHVNAYNNSPVGDYAIVRVTSKDRVLHNTGTPVYFMGSYNVLTHEMANSNLKTSGATYPGLGTIKLTLPPAEFDLVVDSVIGVINVGSGLVGLELQTREMKKYLNRINLNIQDSIDGKPVTKKSDFTYFGDVKVVVNEKEYATGQTYFSQSYFVNKDPDGYFGGNFQILGEKEREELDIRLKHKYSYRNQNYDAYVNTGVVRITDVISDRDKDTLVLEIDSVSTRTSYTIVAGKPYLDKPYTKNITITGYLNNDQKKSEPFTTSAIVSGEVNRIGTFYTRTPDEPDLILHDPVGDRSYASIERGTSKTVSKEYRNQGDGAVGVETSNYLGFGSAVPAAGEFGVGVHFRIASKAGASKDNGTLTEETYTFTETLSTSADEDYVGANGDVYVGTSKNITYALSDVLAYDRKSQKILKTVQTFMDSIGYATTFVYTEKHIKETLLAQLENLIKQSAADSIVSYTNLKNRERELGNINWFNDAPYSKLFETHQKKRGDLFLHKNNLIQWKRVLADNEKNRNGASPYQNKDYLKNISFSTGTSYNNSVTSSNTTRKENVVQVHWELSAAVGAAFKTGVMNEAEILGTVDASYLKTTTGAVQNDTTQTITFHLEDNDPGDFFSVDVLEDQVYKTPVFKLKAGTASCPPEDGAQRRYLSSIQHTLGSEQLNVPAEQPAKFQVKMANLSESDEGGYYSVRVASNKNLNGAKIIFAGQDITNGIASFYLEPASATNKPEYIVPVELYKGAMNSTYKDIHVVMYPECESDMSDYLTAETKDYIVLNATFQNPCTPITLFKPGNNWIVNQSHNNRLGYILENYDASASSTLQYAIVQLRRLNSNEEWKTLGTPILKAELNKAILYQNEFDVSAYPDGDYEVRAVTICSNGANYTSAQVGKIDRTSALVFGIPTPKNGILTKEDIISVDYNKNIRNDTNNPIKSKLTILKTGQQIPIKVLVSGKQIQIVPLASSALDQLENERLEAKIWNVVDDQSGNLVLDTVSWSFVVSRSNLYWSPNSITVNVEEGKTGLFSSLIKNKTAIGQDFSLSRFPTWITPTLRNGRVSPQGELKVDFSISNNLNTGTYIDTVRVVNDGKEQFLYLTVHVLKKAPDWNVNPSKYKYSMNIVSQFSLNDVDTPLSDDILDKVAVFVDQEVRGVAHIEYDVNMGKYYAFITAYTNDLKEKMSFRFWDARPGIEYVARETQAFVNGGVLGAVNNPYVLHPKQVVQTIPLEKGWNWISLYLQDPDMSITKVLSTMKPTNNAVVTALVNSGTMSSFDSTLGWVGTLDSLQLYEAYNVYVDKADTIVWMGQLPAQSHVLPFNDGWNALGYSMPFNVELNSYLRNVQFPQSTRIVSQNEFAVFDAEAGTWTGSLKYLRPNYGYRILTGQNAAFAYSSYAQYETQGNNIVADMDGTLLPKRTAILRGSLDTQQELDVSEFNGGMSTTFAINIGGEVVNTNNASEKIAFRASKSLASFQKLAATNVGQAASAGVLNFTDRFEVTSYADDKLVGISRLQALSNGYIRGFMPSSVSDDMTGKEIRFVVYDAVEKEFYKTKVVQTLKAGDGNRSGTVSAPVVLIIEGDADISITSDLENSTYKIGDTFSYQIMLRNIGEATAINLHMEEVIPPGFVLENVVSDRGAVINKDGKWSYSTINLNKNATDNVRVTLKAVQVGVYSVGNTLLAANNDINQSNNTLYGKEIEVIDERSNTTKIFIPGIITPNGDGINDRFEIVGLGEFITAVNIVIYDKSSNVVFRDNDYKNTWDGGNFPVGSYGYLIKGKNRQGEEVQFSGYVSIVR